MGNEVFAVPQALVAPICMRHGIRRLSLFGSRLTGKARPDSDIDLLVEFQPAARPTLLDMVQIESELSVVFQGCKVDLRTANDLSPYFRDEVVRTARICHDAG